MGGRVPGAEALLRVLRWSPGEAPSCPRCRQPDLTHARVHTHTHTHTAGSSLGPDSMTLDLVGVLVPAPRSL